MDVKMIECSLPIDKLHPFVAQVITNVIDFVKDNAIVEAPEDIPKEVIFRMNSSFVVRVCEYILTAAKTCQKEADEAFAKLKPNEKMIVLDQGLRQREPGGIDTPN